MTGITIRLIGVDRVAADMGRVSAVVRDGAARVLAATAARVVADAQATAPVDTGNLRNSIGASPDGELRWVIGPTANYGIYVELGTSRMRPQPYLAPAADRNTPGFVTAMQQVVTGL